MIDMAEAGEVRLAISDDIIKEVRRVLRGKFHWSTEALEDLEGEVRRFAEHVKPSQAVEVIRDDPSDNRILECAAAANSDFIVSGDQHLLRLGHHGNARIVKVSEFIELARGESCGSGPHH